MPQVHAARPTMQEGMEDCSEIPMIKGRNRGVMRTYFLSILVAAGILACAPAQRPAGKSFLESSVDLLRGQIESGMATAQFTCRQELLCGSAGMPPVSGDTGTSTALV